MYHVYPSSITVYLCRVRIHTGCQFIAGWPNVSCDKIKYVHKIYSLIGPFHKHTWMVKWHSGVMVRGLCYLQPEPNQLFPHLSSLFAKVKLKLWSQCYDKGWVNTWSKQGLLLTDLVKVKVGFESPPGPVVWRKYQHWRVFHWVNDRQFALVTGRTLSFSFHSHPSPSPSQTSQSGFLSLFSLLFSFFSLQRSAFTVLPENSDQGEQCLFLFWFCSTWCFSLLPLNKLECFSRQVVTWGT